MCKAHTLTQVPQHTHTHTHTKTQRHKDTGGAGAHVQAMFWFGVLFCLFVQRMKEEEKQKKIEQRQKEIESRKSLVNIRVVQRNLVYAIGIPPRLAEEVCCVCVCVRAGYVELRQQISA